MGTPTTPARPPLPPFTRESAIQKVRLAEDGWNSRDPAKVALAYASDSRWRNRSEFISGRSELIAFLSRKWAKELDYRLIKEMWAFTGNRVAVRFAYEWHDDSGHWYRSYGNENWEFNDDGLMASRYASINDLPIMEADRNHNWALGRRPDDHPGLATSASSLKETQYGQATSTLYPNRDCHRWRQRPYRNQRRSHPGRPGQTFQSRSGALGEHCRGA